MRTLLALLFCGSFLMGCSTSGSHTANDGRCPHCNQYHEGPHASAHPAPVQGQPRLATPTTDLPLPPLVPAAE